MPTGHPVRYLDAKTCLYAPDEASRECLALIVARQLKHEDVLAALAELFIVRGPANLLQRRSRNGSPRSASRRSTSRRDRHGRTATMNRSTGRCATNGFVAKFLMVQVWVIEIAGQQARLLN